MSDDGDRVDTASHQWRVIDLFAGSGGLTQGFRESGHFVPVAAVEKDVAAAATYAANFGHDHVHWGPIEDWIDEKLPDVGDADVVIGGPPCQGFSNLGKKLSDDPRNELWQRYVATLEKVKPRAFLMENVDRFMRSEEAKLLLAEGNAGGKLEDYDIDVRIVRATDFGAAQLRRRTIVIGTRRDLEPIRVPNWTLPASEWQTVRDVIGKLDAHIPSGRTELPESRFPFHDRLLPGAFKSSELHLTRKYADLSLRRFGHIPAGGNRLDLPDDLKAPCWIGHDTGSFDVMGRLYWDKPSVTIRTEFFKPEKGRYLHPEAHRAITHHEAARIQGFPDDFLWCGSKVQIAKQIGNAVPVPLARAMADHIAAGLEHRPSKYAAGDQGQIELAL